MFDSMKTLLSVVDSGFQAVIPAQKQIESSNLA